MVYYPIHGYWDEKYLQYFETCDEIWHAGDIGSLEVAQKLAAFRPFRAVYGNIDGQDIRQVYPQINRFTIDGAEVLIKHIGGYPAITILPYGEAFWCVRPNFSLADILIY